MLPDDVDARLRREAKRRGTSIAEIVREAVDQQVPRAPADGRLSFFAAGEGSPSDVSERVDELVGEVISQRRMGRSA